MDTDKLPRKLRLTDLNNDVLVNVLKFVKPHHIVSFRETCRSFSRVSKHRTVWLNALRNVMRIYSITEDTFPLESMSLAALEHAALSPHRFVKLLKAEAGNGVLEPTGIRILHPRLKAHEQVVYGASSSGEIRDFCVAPGGRYFIVTSDHRAVQQDSQKRVVVFTLWDIGLGQSENMKVVARMSRPGESLEKCRLLDLYFCTRTPGGERGELNLMFACSWPNAQNTVYMYKIVLSSSTTPEFKLKFEKDIPGTCNFEVSRELNWFIGQTLQAPGMNKFVLLDFLEHRGVSWTAPDCPFSEMEVVCYLFKKTLIVTGPTKDIMVYNIPEMAPIGVDKHVTLNASLILKNPMLGSDPPGSFTGSDSAYSSYTLERPYQSISNTAKLFFLQIKDLPFVPDPSIAEKLPIILGSVSVSGMVPPKYVNFDFTDSMDNEYLIVGHISEDWYKVSVSIFDLDPNGKPSKINKEEPRTFSTCLGHGGDVEMKMIHLCSSTGRFFMLSDTTRRLIHIFDYLRYPK